jgi:hypothetical protein
MRRLRFISRLFFRRLLARTFVVYLDRAGQTFPKKGKRAPIYTTTIFVVDRPYLTLGTIVTKGNRFTDPEYLVEKMKRKARQIGADAIYGLQVSSGGEEAPMPSEQQYSPAWVASGIAVKYTTDIGWISQEKP